MRGHITTVGERVSECVDCGHLACHEKSPFHEYIEQKERQRHHYMDATNIHPLIRVNYYVSSLLIVTAVWSKARRKKEKKKKKLPP